MLVILNVLLCTGIIALPSISFDKNNISFEDIPVNQLRQHIIKILNSGDAELKLNKIRSSCKCLSSQLILKDKNSRGLDRNTKKETCIIQPGDSVSLAVILDTKGLFGKKDFFLLIDSNDPVNPLKRFTVSVSILSPMEAIINVIPEKIRFGLKKGNVVRARILIKNQGRVTLTGSISSKVKVISFSKENFEIEPGRKSIIDIFYELNLKKTVTNEQGFIKIESNASNHASFNIPFILEQNLDT